MPDSKTTRARKQDARQVNRRQKHELAYRAKAWRCSKLAVILADMCAYLGTQAALVYIKDAQAQLRRANREAKRPRGKGK